MIETLQYIDEQVLLIFNGMHTPMVDRFMMTFTGRWIWVPFYAALVWFLLKRMGWRNAAITILGIGVAVSLADQTCATILRPLAERLRPANLENPLSQAMHIVDNYRGGAYGFPSCHAANTFALTTYFAWLGRGNKLSLWLLMWALGNCYTRMYLGVHYPGDLITGAVIGAIAATACYWAMRRVAHIKSVAGNAGASTVIAVLGIVIAGIMAYSIFA